MSFKVEFTTAAQGDLEKIFSRESRQKILQGLCRLEHSPFPDKNHIKRIKGTRALLYRLRVDTREDSFRVFYTIEKPNLIFVLRIIPKKVADRVLKSLL